jgi:nucleotide-binding universal stress UspA family protein
MERKILIVVDGSIHSTRAVQYAVRMSSVVQELTYTLFHVQPTLSQYLSEEARSNPAAKAHLKKVTRQNDATARGVLEKHKARMVLMGIGGQRIDVVTQPKVLGIAKDILDYAERGLYDAILIGRRGLTRLQQTFMGSTAAKLVQHSALIPVWVVDGQVESDSLMLAVDGSEASLRAVDHVSFMVGGNEKIKLTLFHVMPSLKDYCTIDFNETKGEADKIIAQGAKQCIDHFYAQAKKTLMAAGFQEKQIEVKTAKRIRDIGKAVVNQARKGGYGTVVVGRRGIDNAFFMGSVSRQVLDRVSGRAVWVIS